MTKRYTNPSADIITVLAGLDEVDAVFFEFANAIESIIRTGRSGRFFEFNEHLHMMLRDYSGDSQQGYRCCSFIDFRGLSDKPCIILCTPRFISSFDEGMWERCALIMKYFGCYCCLPQNAFPISSLIEFNKVDWSIFRIWNIHLLSLLAYILTGYTGI